MVYRYTSHRPKPSFPKGIIGPSSLNVACSTQGSAVAQGLGAAAGGATGLRLCGEGAEAPDFLARHHPFLFGIFPEIDHPAIGGTPMAMESPIITKDDIQIY